MKVSKEFLEDVLKHIEENETWYDENHGYRVGLNELLSQNKMPKLYYKTKKHLEDEKVEAEAMNTKERIKDFLTKLQKLSDDTGIYIEEFGDQFYNPSLEFREENTSDLYSLSLNDGDDFNKSKKYIVRKGNGYDGEIL